MLITHDMGVVAEMADKIMVMYAGMVIEYATAREMCIRDRVAVLAFIPTAIIQLRRKIINA